MSGETERWHGDNSGTAEITVIPALPRMLDDHRSQLHDDAHETERWTGLQTMVRVRAERRCGDQRSVEERYDIGSFPDEEAATAERVVHPWALGDRESAILGARHGLP
jgi:hypothetical protein